MHLNFLDAGDLYVWGWNESGQLGLPSQNLRKISERKAHQQGLQKSNFFCPLSNLNNKMNRNQFIKLRTASDIRKNNSLFLYRSATF